MRNRWKTYWHRGGSAVSRNLPHDTECDLLLGIAGIQERLHVDLTVLEDSCYVLEREHEVVDDEDAGAVTVAVAVDVLADTLRVPRCGAYRHRKTAVGENEAQNHYRTHFWRYRMLKVDAHTQQALPDFLRLQSRPQTNLHCLRSDLVLIAQLGAHRQKTPKYAPERLEILRPSFHSDLHLATR